MFSLPLIATGQTQRLHGHSDVFTERGTSIVWAVLRGADEQTTHVVWRIVVDPRETARLVVEGIDPFSQAKRVVQNATGETNDIWVPRTHFSDFPRTEISFFAKTAPTQAKTLIYYLGVPDTTPEFNTPEALQTYFDARVKSLSANRPAQPAIAPPTPAKPSKMP